MRVCSSNQQSAKLDNGVVTKSKYVPKNKDDQTIFSPFAGNKSLLNPMNVEDVYIFGTEFIGEGSFGVVRKATHKSSLVDRAVKIIDKGKSGTKLVSRIKDEINILHKLDHPNILKIFEYFEDGNHLYIITEYLEGGELFSKWDPSSSTEEDLAWMMKQILSAVAYCHRLNIWHRDIK